LRVRATRSHRAPNLSLFLGVRSNPNPPKITTYATYVQRVERPPNGRGVKATVAVVTAVIVVVLVVVAVTTPVTVFVGPTT